MKWHDFRVKRPKKNSRFIYLGMDRVLKFGVYRDLGALDWELEEFSDGIEIWILDGKGAYIDTIEADLLIYYWTPLTFKGIPDFAPIIPMPESRRDKIVEDEL